MNTQLNKEVIEKEYQELFEMAKVYNPDLEFTLSTLNNMIAQTDSIQDYLNLTTQTPAEISSNQILFL